MASSIQDGIGFVLSRHCVVIRGYPELDSGGFDRCGLGQSGQQSSKLAEHSRASRLPLVGLIVLDIAMSSLGYVAKTKGMSSLPQRSVKIHAPWLFNPTADPEPVKAWFRGT